HRAIALAPRQLPEAPAPPPDEAAQGSEAEHHFRVGLSALRDQEPARAADSFERASRSSGAAAIAEGADFWRAVALARARRAADARAALGAFIADHRRSPRVGEASAILGWLLLEAGDADGAAARFQVAARDPVPSVSRSGEVGLSALSARRERSS